ncbi:efflux RND transporter periplasmic adaptor subunit [Roseateles sp. BYS180W]|uniref:Efflux RND transporter periplasmic adaptor subunit n=1 Tax=Roseateles rivi TaxID=3299028 RepID=A0ABW7FV84_9BURK
MLLDTLRIDDKERVAPSTVPRWVWGAGLLGTAVLALGAWWWWAGAQQVQVQTATAQAVSAPGNAALLQATGYVTARRQATVSAQITGTLTEVLIEEGVYVKKGQVLARLDDTGLQATLGSAEASWRSAQANVEQYRAHLAQAQADARRAEELATSGMVSRQSTEQASTAVKTAAAQLLAAQRQVDVAAAQLAQARVNFNYATLRAPFDGVVTVKAAQVGEIISPLSAGGGFTRTGVGTIVDMNSLEVDVDVNETYIGQVKAQMRCEAVLDAYPDWRIPAHVVAVIPSADRGKATVKVRVALEQKDARVVPDMGVRVNFLRDKEPEAAPAKVGVLLPPEALIDADGKASVFVLGEGGRVSRRPVTLGSDIGKQKWVREGLKPGEVVVVAAPKSLKDGDAVVANKEAP